MSTETILVVDDNPANIGVLMDCLGREGYRMLVAGDGQGAVEQARLAQPDLILLDVMMPGMDGFQTAEALKGDEKTRDIPVIFITALDNSDEKVRGFQLGAVDYVTKPFQHEEVLARVGTHLALRRLQRNLEGCVAERTTQLREANLSLRDALAEVERLKNRLQEENVYLRDEIQLTHHFEQIVYRGDLFKKVLQKVEQVAETPATVLILGESGTGKELVARAVHLRSNRSDRPLVKVNCAALPANLLESELFGHEKGAFTGAFNRKIGRFELADGGTLFLDEIGEMPIEIQAKILRALQEGEFDRVGGAQTLKADVRIIAATNRDLPAAIREKTFREDLYYRLNVFPITLPPLRLRKEDIPLLVQRFITRHSVAMGKNITKVSQRSMEALQAYSWPGNVRELENVIERAVILTRGETLEVEESLASSMQQSPSVSTDDRGPLLTLEEVEREHILKVLEETNRRIEGNSGAAQLLGLRPSTLRSRMQKLGIKRG